ncbi:unnamed protein product [Rotaria sordida]|uniref:FAD-binding PCMH-type domain-containing protein n=2 Tax=Rotaria sordida TaxID=392033 RepID=A0A814JU01_9BILA|nr:unnamed protein product [Rotaria sordida]
MVLCNFDELLSAPSTCYDNIRNLDEAGVGCDGVTCSRICDRNEKYAVASDYKNAASAKGVCLDKCKTILAICKRIENKISSASEVFYPFDVEYNNSINHPLGTSSAFSICTVEPGTAYDVARVLTIIRETQVPFGIKGGGHSFNPGFSSTTGILIAMSRFRQITYHPTSQTVELGAGLLWGDVYQALDPLGVTVVGGRISSVGVAGLILGGGYSWKSNQYGLSIDNAIEYEVSGAYPHVPSSTPPLPMIIQFSWALPSDDNVFIDGLKSATKAIRQAAFANGQDVGGSKEILYPNNALEDTPLEQMYGKNLPKLRRIRQEWDPNNIMCLCGGFKF